MGSRVGHSQESPLCLFCSSPTHPSPLVCCDQGTEYLQYGLQTAAATHWLYDWAALIFILKVWSGPGGSGGSGGEGGNTEAGPESSP